MVRLVGEKGSSTVATPSAPASVARTNAALPLARVVRKVTVATYRRRRSKWVRSVSGMVWLLAMNGKMTTRTAFRHKIT